MKPLRRPMRIAVALAIGMACWLAGPTASRADEPSAKERGELTKHLAITHVKLENGIRAAANAGRPISAKFEVESAHLQLSVYTEKGGKFSEVLVDTRTGKVRKAEAITAGEDLAAAGAQSKAMAAAKGSLDSAVSQALQANAGWQAVSAAAGMKGGSPTVDVVLFKQHAFKTVSVRLR